MSRKHLLSGMVLCVLVCEAQAQGLGPPRGRDGIALTQVPAIVVVGQADDARVALVRAGVAHWNQLLAGIGSGFRLGQVSLGRANQAGEVGKIVVVLSDAEFISHVRRLPDGQGAVAMIRNTNGPPMSLPNIARNVIAHELGHAIGRPQQRPDNAYVWPAGALPSRSLRLADNKVLSIEPRIGSTC